jgi:hypothetical protein
MIRNTEMYDAMPLGIVLRRAPAKTKWIKWTWSAVAVLPGAEQANWRVLRQEGDVVEYHAATLTLELHGAETEAYLHGLSSKIPSVYILLRTDESSEHDLTAVLITASPYEAQDYADNGEDIIEKIPMPPALVAWVRDFIETHHEEEVFKKRRRDKLDVSKVQDGIGDARIQQLTDVYRAPVSARKERLQ